MVRLDVKSIYLDLLTADGSNNRGKFVILMVIAIANAIVIKF